MEDTFSEISVELIREPDFGYEKGDILQGRYEIFEQTRGGTGQIYFCMDRQEQIPCVLKAPLIQFQAGKTKEDAGNFLGEIQNMLKLPPHGNVVKFYRLEIIQDIYFIVMEWAAASLKRKITAKKPVKIEEILRISISVCKGMRHCGKWLSKPDKPFVHGDLKPDNILLTNEGEVRIADFGIGGYTRAYASLEQLRGEMPDSRSDIFSLGKIMKELLECGRSRNDVLSSQEEKLFQIVEQCLKIQKEERIDSFERLESLLEALYEELTETQTGEEIPFYREKALNMTRACALASIGEYEEAFEILTALTDEIQESDEKLLAQGFYNIAEIFRNRGSYEEALKFYDRAIESDHDTHSWIWANKCVVCRCMGQWEKAYYCAERALQIDPYDGPAIDNKIDCLIELNRPDELEHVFRDLQSLYKKQPKAERLLKNMAYILYVKHEFEGACSYFEHYLRCQKEDSDWSTLYYYASSLYAVHDTTKSRKYFQSAIHRMKAGGAAEITRTRLLYLGISYYYLMDWEKSVQCLEEFQSRFEEVPQSESLGLMLQHDLLVIDEYFPDFSEINGNVVNIVWSNHPEKCFTELIGKLEEQRKRWENELLDGDSSNMVRYMNTACFADEAVCHMKMEQYEKAVKACEKALFWDHSSPEILYTMGQSLNMLERYTEALDCFEKALKYQDHAQRAYEIRTRIQEIRDMMKTSDEFRNSFIRRMFEVAKKEQGNPAELQKLISGKEEIFDEAFLGLLEYHVCDAIALLLAEGTNAELEETLRGYVFLAGEMQQIHGRTREICIEGAIIIYNLLERYEFDYGGIFSSVRLGIQPFLAIAYLERIHGSIEDNVEKSIAIFQFCIKLYTDWSDHAMLAELFCNMGNAYVKRIAGSREENLETAFMYYEKAAAWISERSDPDKWAMLQFNLGVCEHKRNHIETAVMFFRNCLRYYNALTNPEHFAKANMELGDIFYTNCLNAGKVSDMLAEALNCYENAISYFESEDFAEECANIRLRMALVMKALQ